MLVRIVFINYPRLLYIYIATAVAIVILTQQRTVIILWYLNYTCIITMVMKLKFYIRNFMYNMCSRGLSDMSALTL